MTYSIHASPLQWYVFEERPGAAPRTVGVIMAEEEARFIADLYILQAADDQFERAAFDRDGLGGPWTVYLESPAHLYTFSGPTLPDAVHKAANWLRACEVQHG